MNSGSSRPECSIIKWDCHLMDKWGFKKDILVSCDIVCVCVWFWEGGPPDALFCLMHRLYEPNVLKAWVAASSRGQHTTCDVLCVWWNTGWCHLIASSEYSTCLSVFWRNKRDGGNSCGGRERGGSQDITQGLYVSSTTHSSHIHQGEHVNM